MTDNRNPSHTPLSHDPETPDYSGATGGWGSLEGIANILGQEAVTPDAFKTLARQNKPRGVMCTSCAWAKPATPHTFEFCENGAKATLWELTKNRATPEFFAQHDLAQLRSWHDHDLEKAGRLTHPMRYDRATDRYVATDWSSAIADIAGRLRSFDPKSTVFYSSGHAGLEAAYLYALFARAWGHQNLPQSSNMCHETTSVGLKEVIGTPVGTCTLEDFEHCDAIFFFGQNTGSNSPRFLHVLKSAVERGCRIITFNPLREKGLIEFVDPQNVVQMTVGKATQISEKYFQVRPGGDVAVLAGMIKTVLAAEEREPGAILDHAFIERHTSGFSETIAAIQAIEWGEIERHSGLSRGMIEDAAEVYLTSKNVIGIYGMGLTQHVNGWLNLGMLVNLLLLRGNLGRLGAGISPVRGHSNVQGQRTVGVGEKSAHMPADKLKELFGVEAPEEEGLNAVHAARQILDRKIKAIVMLGGNLVRALPDRLRLEEAWPNIPLTVYIATKLNRSHLYPGETAYILPCLGRLEQDVQASGPQSVTMEDSLSHIYGSIGEASPPSEQVRSEVAIVAALARATLPDDADDRLRWEAWAGDYGLIRDLIEKTFPDDFAEFNARMFEPGGFYRGNTARERKWKTKTGKAIFTPPTTSTALGEDTAGESAKMTLVTLRSNDQFNTTIYAFSDRLRGLDGRREVLLINKDEMARLGLSEGQEVTLESTFDDGIDRKVSGLTVTAFDLPEGCVAGYYPELNPLVPLDYNEKKSNTPASKGAPVRIVA